MVSELISASVSGRASEAVKDESSTLKLLGRTSDNSQIVHHNASCQQHDVKNRV